MKKHNGIQFLALILGSAFTVASLAACGPQDDGGTTGGGPIAERICFNNLSGTSYLSESVTKTAARKGAKDFVAYALDGDRVSDYKQIATYDEATGTFTAVSEGKISCKLEGDVQYTLEVVPAYATEPNNKYNGNNGDFNRDGNENVLGNTHDPSFLETTDAYGRSSYYLFSTGWATGNDVHVSTDGMVTWEYLGKTTQVGDYDDETIFPSELKEWMNSTNNSGDLQWWAPDIVEAKGGGYWFYTCLVMADNRMPRLVSSDTKVTPTDTYSRACIVMYHLKDLNEIDEEGALEYKGVLMQSAIPQGGGGGIDVNAIDPQIIYTPDGKMYMAYGSFGTGNWMIELDPETGLRKDKVNDWKEWEWVRRQRNFVVSGNEEEFKSPSADKTECGAKLLSGEGYTHDYYGTMISVGAMEAPVIARHDNVKVFDETTENPDAVEGKTFYYSMHSYNGLADNYQMWGGRSESVLGAYLSAGGGHVFNVNVSRNENQGNKYMGGFEWQSSSRVAGCTEYASCLTGHNDLYTTANGTHVAAYINRNVANVGQFVVQIHQYYLNSKGDICINPNRYGREIDRGVTEEELFALTDGGKFEMVFLTNDADWAKSDTRNTIKNISETVTLDKDTHKVMRGTSEIGSFQMYGDGYIKFTFNEALSGSNGTGEAVYYGVVRPTWLRNREQSGFTITCLGNTADSNRNYAMFMNSYSTIEL